MAKTQPRYILDALNWGRRIEIELTERGILCDVLSHRQRIVIADTVRYREMLLLGERDPNATLAPQFAMADEHRYHQMLVWLPLLFHDNPTVVDIFGGGDLLAARRAILCHTIKEVNILDWDLEVKHLTLEHIPAIEALKIHEDSRVRWNREVDVRDYLLADIRPVPIIIWDLVDAENLECFAPNANTSAVGLLYEKLKNGGVVSIQGDEYSPDPVPLETMASNLGNLKKWFQTVLLLKVAVGSFGYQEAIYLCFKGREVKPRAITQDELKKHFGVERDRYFLTPEMIQEAFILDSEIKRELIDRGLL